MRRSAEITERAIELRKERRSLRAISKELSVPRGTLAYWLKDIPVEHVERALIPLDEAMAHLTAGNSSNAVGKMFGVSPSTLRRRLKEHGLVIARSVGANPERRCRMCQKPFTSTRRRRCGACDTKIRRIRAKDAGIKLMGGKCLDCGWSGPNIGFDFHHLDAKGKDFAVGEAANKSWSILIAEIKKCVLLCATCHRLRHDAMTDAWREEALAYSGRVLNLAE
jgi:DNA-binding protein Fis